MDSAMKTRLERQQYRFAGGHSAVKVCHWTKQSLLNKDTCYKERFYGISSGDDALRYARFLAICKQDDTWRADNADPADIERLLRSGQ